MKGLNILYHLDIHIKFVSIMEMNIQNESAGNISLGEEFMSCAGFELAKLE